MTAETPKKRRWFQIHLSTAISLFLLGAMILWLPFKLGMVGRYIAHLRNKRIAECKLKFTELIQSIEASGWKTSKAMCREILKKDSEHWGVHTLITLEEWVQNRMPQGCKVVNIKVELTQKGTTEYFIDGILKFQCQILPDMKGLALLDDAVNAMELNNRIPKEIQNAGTGSDAMAKRYHNIKSQLPLIKFRDPIVASIYSTGRLPRPKKTSKCMVLFNITVPFEIQPICAVPANLPQIKNDP